MDTEDRIKSVLRAIAARDPELGKELEAARSRQDLDKISVGQRVMLESAVQGAEVHPPRLVAETIVLRTGRPVLEIDHGNPKLVFADAESEVWRARLTKARDKIGPAISSVGRINLENNPSYDWVGTGWMVRHDVVVTNRHVAFEFGQRASGQNFVFRPGTDDGPMTASIDFLQEYNNPGIQSFRLIEILDIEDESGPDLAFIRVEGSSLPPEIKLSSAAASAKQGVAVIGYPARDSRIPEQPLMEQIFGNVYNKKRLAPGQITRSSENELQHDCSTLGGNSGSVILDLASGEALGIHFAGRFLEANFAVPAAVLQRKLESVLTGETRRRPVIFPNRTSDARPAHSAPSVASSVTWTIPVRITVDLGPPAESDRKKPAAPSADRSDQSEIDVAVSEGVPEDYSNRKGYQEDFLGETDIVPVPKITRDEDQLVEFEFEGTSRRVLDYEHFSVLMNRKRRLCFFSIVNIDGKTSRSSARSTWRWDPRIPKQLQIMYECYGNSPKYSRGHMTRREDPVWGPSADAALGNNDSMHVTNVTPQMQSFNAPIWLGLENYALQNARKDKMRISVITGPVLKDDDPTLYGVAIPRSFWKVIAFLHDSTGKLTATGYSISQEEQMPAEEKVFGPYLTYQRSLAWIEQQAGVSFGSLKKCDPLQGKEEEALPVPLREHRQIRFDLS